MNSLVAAGRGCRLILLGLACALGVGCGGRSNQAPIWIGHVATLSGPEKQTGEAAARGIRLAVEEFNKNIDGGLGRPIKVLHSDARGDVGAFESDAVRLVSINRVWFLLGGNAPDEVERLERAGVPVICPLGARTRTMSESVYCTGLAPAQLGKALGVFAVWELAADSVVLISDDRRDEFAESADVAEREFRAAWTKKDVNIVPVLRRLRITKDAKVSDWASELEKQIAGGCKAVLFAGRAPEWRELIPMVNVPLLAGGVSGGAALPSARPAGKELYFVTSFVRDPDGEAASSAAADFARRYKDAFQEEANVNAALAYEDVKLLYQAMLQCKDSLSAGRIREELDKLKDVGGLTGPLTFTADRQLRRTAFVVRIDEHGAKTLKRYNADD